MTDTNTIGTAVEGHVEPGFEGLRETFQQADIGVGGAAFAAYVDGHLVADLWKGVQSPGVAWNEQSVTTLFSTTKTLAAISGALLAERGLLDVDAPVSTYWPEFAQAGKETALVRHVLSHTVGVLGFRDAGTLLDFDGTGWDQYDEIASRLAATPPAWEPGTRNSYHAISYGWLVGELVRRIDGRTLGRFFQEEIAGPLGLDLWIGTPQEVQDTRAATVTDIPTDGLPEFVIEMRDYMTKLGTDPSTLLGLQSVAAHGTSVIEQAAAFFGTSAGRTPEQAGAGGVGSARSLARMFALLSLGGELDGVRLLSPATVERFAEVNADGPAVASLGITLPNGLELPPLRERWALGYMRNLKDAATGNSFGPNERAFGHPGMGGQVAFADPDRHLAVGFVRSAMAISWDVSEALVARLYEAL